MRILSHLGTLALAVTAALAISGCAALGIGVAGGAAAGGVETAKAEQREDLNRDAPRYGPGTYAATIISNAVYVPAKVVFAGAGAATSGVAYLVSLGDKSVSRPIWDASVGGDYIVTPAMVSGHQRVKFVG